MVGEFLFERVILEVNVENMVLNSGLGEAI
jgi:hypothetical protein